MAAPRLLRAVAIALAVASLGAAQDYVSQALANSFSVDGDASVRAVRIMLNGDNSVLTVAWDDDPAAVADEFCGARQLEDAANREVVGHIAAALQSDGATRRALLDWADRVDDAIAPERPGAPLFELVVAQGYGPLAVVGGDTARGAADAWCAEFAIAESECYFVAATVRREAAQRSVAFGEAADAASPRPPVARGDAVLALWPADGRYYRARVAAVAADGSLELHYDDGDYRAGALPIEVRRVADDAAAAPRPAGGGSPRPRAPEPRAAGNPAPVPEPESPRTAWAAVAALQSLVLAALVARHYLAGAPKAPPPPVTPAAPATPPPRPPRPPAVARDSSDDAELPPRPAPHRARAWGGAKPGRRRSATRGPSHAPATPSPARRSAEKKVRRSLSTAPKSASPADDALARDRAELVAATPGSPAHKAAWRKMWATSRGGGAAGAGGDGGAFESWYASMFAAPPSGSDGGAVVLEAEDADSDSWSDVDGDGDALQAAETELLKAKTILAAAAAPPPRKAAPKRA